MSCAEFIAALGSKAPVPGGGGASALVGAMGIALGHMVGALTIGKTEYAEAAMLRLQKEAERLQEELLALVQQDAEAVEPFIRAYRMPQDTEVEKTEKARALESALRGVCVAPLEIMKKCGAAIGLNKAFALMGYPPAASDAGAGIMFCKAALFGAAITVYINTAAMTDRTFAQKINGQADALRSEYGSLADQVFETITDQLR
jgi:formiminotetrahydrofolate cyclodeaminase